MLKAVVFDMDGTLLDINLSAFITVLMKEESSLLAQVGRKNPLSVFAAYGRGLLEVNAADHDGARTNRQIFDDCILRHTGIPLSDPVIADVLAYYEREVLPARNDRVIAARPMPGAHKALEAVANRGLRTALFTNPSFSGACIGCRMGWADIGDAPFELVTFMENSRHCKPTADYYREGLAKMGLDPSEVLMVGNDPKRDFPVPDFGLKTAYVGGGEPQRALWCGSMAGFAENLDRVIELFEAADERGRKQEREQEP